MRKIVFGVFFYLVAFNLFGGTDPLENFRFQLGPGVDILGQNFNTINRTYGLSGEAALGYALDNHWSLWLNENFYYFPAVDSPLSSQFRYEADFYETVLSVRYTFTSAVIKPFLTAGFGEFIGYEGGGWDTFIPSSSWYSYFVYTAPLIQVGLGAELPIDSGLSAFIETKVNIIFVSYTFSQPLGSPPQSANNVTAIEIPVNVGVMLKL